MANISVHSIENDLLGQMGVIVCVSYANSGGYLKAESHMLLRDPQQTIVSRSLRFDHKPSSDGPVSIDDSFMLQQGLEEARLALSEYLDQLQQDSFQIAQWRSASVRQGDVATLFRSWIRGALPKLDEIYRNTDCDELRTYLKPIISVRKIRRGGL